MANVFSTVVEDRFSVNAGDDIFPLTSYVTGQAYSVELRDVYFLS